jgi:hypothetical protein
MNYLTQFSTKDLVEELVIRVGVNEMKVEPYQIEQIEVEGPAIVLVVID